MEIISRAAWGARYSAGFGPAPLPAREVWLHHSVTIAPDLVPPWTDDYAAVRLLEQIGQDRFGGGISYTFIVTPAGLIFEGHGVARQGAHTAGRNSIARAICLIGNYEVARPTAAQMGAVAWLLAYGADPARGWWPTARLSGGHRDAPGQSTACPGANAEAAIPAINGLAGATTTTTTTTTGDDDVSWTHAQGAPPIPDYYPGATHDLPDPATALGWAAAHAAIARDRATEAGVAAKQTRDTVAVLVEGVRALSQRVDALAALIAEIKRA